MRNDIDNQTLTEMVSDPAIYNIFESFDLKTPASVSKKERIKEALQNIKKKRLLESDSEEEEEEEDLELDFDLSEFDEEDANENEESTGDPVMDALAQAKELLDQATDAYSGGTDEDSFEEDEDDEEDEDADVEESLDLFERRERIRAFFEAKKSDKEKEKEKKAKEKEKEEKEKAKAKEKKEKEKEKKAKAKEKEEKAKADKKAKADAKKEKASKKIKEAIRRRVLKKKIEERIAAIKEASAPGAKVYGKYPKSPSKFSGGHQKMAGAKIEYPKAGKKAVKGNLKPKHGSVSSPKGEAVKKAGKFPGSVISKQKEAEREQKEVLKKKIKEALRKIETAK